MFNGAIVFDQDISGWDVSSVNNMSLMFLDARAFDQNLSPWNISNVSDMVDMFDGVTLSTPNYDALLIGWSGLPLNNDVEFDGGSSLYSPSAQFARNILTDTYNWTVIDGGVAP